MKILRFEDIDFDEIHNHTRLKQLEIVFSKVVNEWVCLDRDKAGVICLLKEHLPEVSGDEKFCIRGNKWCIYTGERDEI